MVENEYCVVYELFIFHHYIYDNVASWAVTTLAISFSILMKAVAAWKLWTFAFVLIYYDVKGSNNFDIFSFSSRFFIALCCQYAD